MRVPARVPTLLPGSAPASLTLALMRVAAALLAASPAVGADRAGEASEIIETARGPTRRFYVTHLHGGGLAGRCYGYLDISAEFVAYTPVREQLDHAFSAPRNQVSAEASALWHPEVHLKAANGRQKFIVVDRDMVERVRSALATRAHTKPPKLLAAAITEPNLPPSASAVSLAAAPAIEIPTVPPTSSPASSPSVETAETMFERAWQYREGRGVAQDFAQAAVWFQKAAAAGSVRARYDLAILHLYGLGVPTNDLRARSLLYQAAADNYAPPLRLLGTLELAEGNRDAGLKFLEQAATLGDKHAAYLAGLAAHARRKESEERWAQAQLWLERAARAGHPAAAAFVDAAWTGASPGVRAKVPAEFQRVTASPERPASRAFMLDFEGASVGTPDASTAYLKQRGITVSEQTTGTRLEIADARTIYEGAAVRAVSGHHVFTQTGMNAAITFTLRFAEPASDVTFARAALLAGPSGISHPAWKATALDANNRSVEMVEEEYLVSMADVPARTFRFSAPAIAAVRFESDGYGRAAFSGVVLDDLSFTRAAPSEPAPEIATVARSAPAATRPAASVDPAVDDNVLATLIEQRRIELEARGAGVDALTVRLRRVDSQLRRIEIPAGTLFESRETLAPLMVTTKAATLPLNSDDWTELRLEAACHGLPKKIPEPEDEFTVYRFGGAGPQVVRLLDVLEEAEADYLVRQAAIWIAAKNADYDALGVLIHPFRQTREIGEHTTSEAMKLCAQAGIDLEAKAVWSDRARIYRRLHPGPMKTWLASRDDTLDAPIKEIAARMQEPLAALDPEKLAAFKAPSLRVLIALPDDSSRTDEAVWLQDFLQAQGHEVNLSTPVLEADDDGAEEAENVPAEAIKLFVAPRHRAIAPTLNEIVKALFEIDAVRPAKRPVTVEADVVLSLD